MTHPGWGAQWTPTDAAADRAEASRGSQHRRRVRRRRRLTRRLLAGFVGVVALVLAGAVWVGLDARHARGELQAAATEVQNLQDQVVAGDRGAAASTLVAMQEHSMAARADTHGPHWSAAGLLPLVGPNVRAVQTVSDVIADLATQALPTLMDATSLVDPSTLAPVDGRIELAPLVEAAPQVVEANSAVQRAAARIGSIDQGPLLALIAAPLTDLDTQIQEVAMTTATAARAVQLLPPMLGADGPREYLLLVQNNAEQRATGGIPGSVILLRAIDGVVEVVDQRSGGSMGDLPESVLPLTAGEQALFGTGLGADMRDVTFTPDFPRSAELARAIWDQAVGGEVDGVLSIDPGTLANVLGATGPITLPAGQELTSENAQQLLLNSVYLDVADPGKQDVFFASTAAAVFGAMVSGQGEATATVDALALSAREGRLMVWSAHEDEQSRLAGTVLSGELVGYQGSSPVIGVYLNDGSAAKMGYYLRSDVAVVSDVCLADRSQTITVRVTLTSTAPLDAADLPPYLTGAGVVIPRGEIKTNVLFYAPSGALVDSVRISIDDPGVFAQTHDGLTVAGKTVQLKPGDQVVLTYDIRTKAGQSGPPVIRATPGTFGEVDLGDSPGCEGTELG